jgi:DNA-binding winged helix-turn-helix (wHTH) protein/tetratricopeptide (TPR) repeat protein
MLMRSFRFAGFTLDVESACLLRDGERQPLSAKDFGVLHHLVAHRERVIPHAELLEVVWRGTAVGSDVLKVRVRRLRGILGDDARSPRFIASVHGEGYRFVAPVVSSPVGAEPSQSAPPPRPPMIGRGAELAQLQDLLARAASGRRQIVFVTGEAGIGKTTLIDALAEGMPGAWIGRGQCIEHVGSGEPYLPVMEALGRLARTDAHEQLAAVLRRIAPSWLLELPALIDSQEREALQRQGLGLTLARRLRELAEALEALTTSRAAGNAPQLLVLVLEDLHWTDSSTIELLTMLARRPDPARLLVLGSYRSVAATAADHPLRSMLQELRAHSAITEIALQPLLEEEVARFLEARFPANDFSPELAPALHQRTGGNPLFLSDVVREWVARQLVVRADAGWAFRGDVETIRGVIPASLRHLIEKQRDELRPVEQRLLQAASAVGLEFSVAAVAAALAEDPADTEEHALRLAERERLRIVGSEEWPDGTHATRFSFPHALYRDLWSERIPASRRRDWHQRIAERKEAAFGDSAHEIAAELAAHFEQGRDLRRAVSYYAQASGRAWQRAAESEARGYLNRALALLDETPESSERLAHELQLQLRLGQLLAYTEGYESAASEHAYRRAHEICAHVGDSAAQFQCVGGLFHISAFRGEARLARELASQLLQIAEQTKDPIRVGYAHLSLGQMLLLQGEPVDALRHMELALELCRANWNDDLLPVYGLHFEVVILGTLAAILQLLGHPGRASRYGEELSDFLREDAHPLTATGALWGVVMLRQMRGDAASVTDLAESLLRRCATYGPKDWIPLGESWLKWGLAAQGRIVDPTSCASGLKVAGVFDAYALGMTADGHRRLGRVAEARDSLREAFAAAERYGPGWYDAELHRLDGELRLDADEAEACFRQALAIARSQRAKSWELRAAMSLGELWRRQGKDDEARALVQETYGCFTDGFDSPDLERARSFLRAPSEPDEALVSGRGSTSS